MADALAHLQAARLSEAEDLYRQILAVVPNHPDAINNLGVVNYQQGKNEIALAFFAQAIALNGQSADYYWNRGLAFQALGRIDEMITAYTRSIELGPTWARLIALANRLFAAGQCPQAAVYYIQALNLVPEDVDVLNLLGESLRQTKHFAEATVALERAIVLNPNHSGAIVSLGATFYDQGRLADAEACFRRAIACDPKCDPAYSNLGELLRQFGQANLSLPYCRKAIELAPRNAMFHDNLGNALKDLGDLGQARASFRQAIALDPGYAKAKMNLAITELLTGDFDAGWKDYEARLQDWPVNRSNLPPWTLDCPRGSTVLVQAEQGLGDTIQFLRYVPLILDRGHAVVVEVQNPSLADLARSISDVTVVVRGEPLPPFDFHVALLSLPLVFGTTLANIPVRIPYLRADPAAGETWRRRLGAGRGLKVGLVWAGNPTHKHDCTRSIPLRALEPLLKVPGVRLFAMQKELRPGDEETLAALGVVNLAAELGGFAKDAGALAHLDLTIAVDTSAAHLAGALGSPVWVMLAYMPDWRWLLDRDDSPWYPTARLFRQQRYGDWAGVIESVAAELAKFAATKCR